MFDITGKSIAYPISTWILILIFLFGGTAAFSSLGRLEDPAFTIKVAAVVTSYPGASAATVGKEVSEPLESAIQKMGEVGKITSRNTPGLSIIEVEIKDTIKGDKLPGIWTKLRARVQDTELYLPEGVQTPIVNDDFGDVFGIYFAVTADGYSDREKHDLATYLRRELLAVKGVADVDVSGLPQEAIYVEPELAIAANQNIPLEAFIGAISRANSVVDAGESGTLRLENPEGSDSVSEIAGLSIGVDNHVINLVDLANVKRKRTDDPSLIIRFDGKEAFTIGVAGLPSENIVEVGKRVDQHLSELMKNLPAGVVLNPIYEQHKVVEEASNAFLINLAMSVAIVVVVLAIFMGWRAALTVGATLLLTVMGTLLFMALFSIEMERISLGALIIAMGMLVDNAIVVAEGMQGAMLRGKSSREAASEASAKTQIPLLGATIIGILAFAPIGLSPDSTGEFMFSLFAVIGISLLLSWVLAITVTPLIGHYLFKVRNVSVDEDSQGLIMHGYGLLLTGALRARWLVAISLVGITIACLANFGNIKEQFFPYSNNPLFFVNYKLQQGAPIQSTDQDINELERWLDDRDDVVSHTSFVGEAALRFMLTYPTQQPNRSYGHIVVRVQDVKKIPQIMADMTQFASTHLPDGEFHAKQLAFGPGSGDPIQLRLSGPDPSILRDLGEEIQKIMQENSDNFTGLRTDWREQEMVIVPDYATQRAQSVGITRDNVAETLRFATKGILSGVYREDERQIPIYLRAPQNEHIALLDHLVYSSTSQKLIPMEQVLNGLTLEAQDTLYHRRDRVPTLTVSGTIRPELQAANVLSEVKSSVEAIQLPTGYSMAWGGEYEDTLKANTSLANQLPFAVTAMVVISLLLFNALRQPLIIWLLVPMAANGAIIGLLVTGLPFSFTALLGLLSLSGMLIKNGIVLVEEIDIVRKGGKPLEESIVKASASRLRPVFLAAATTILGMLPLLGDAFFVSMAVTIMAGLAFATILTLFAAPVFYRLMFREAPEMKQALLEKELALPA